ncbi:MAG TPA: polyphosphate kinase 1 [Pyrinomonadaceae bacterium]|nr:polyphosphate kinase 1 [Pyrinomonadaceae bacterium]
MSTVANEAEVREFPSSRIERVTPFTAVTPLFLNRELSLLEFHARVLEEALDPSNPLLERLKFLFIFSSNLDEFFMIRVSGLKEGIEHGVTERSSDGLTAEEQLDKIRQRIMPLIDLQCTVLQKQILPELEREGIRLLGYESLTRQQRAHLHTYFVEKIFPVLTPQAVDPAHPFPFVSPLSLNLGLMVEPPDDSSIDGSKLSGPRFVRIKVPSTVARLIPVDLSGTVFVLAEEVIEANVGELFPGMLTSKAHRFRITRDADMEIREEEAEDLLSRIQQELRRRKFGAPVRLEVSKGMPQDMIDYLTQSLDLSDNDVYVIDGPLGVQDLTVLSEVDRPDLKYAPFKPAIPQWFSETKSIFDAIKEQDRLLHHPYDSYDCVTGFLNQAVDDPDVLAIKICLYRTGPDSPIPPALIRAAYQGKQVTALIELKARFDEEYNIEWARKLDYAGVHVVYGIVGLKTHGKLTLVVRNENGVLRKYVHVASGNYNPTTSCTYTDVGMFTADQEIGKDAAELFNYLTGYSRQTDYRRLFVAPVNLRKNLNTLLDREIQHQRAGRPARIIAKLNRLADKQMIEKLYETAQAGVKIDLVVRGICMLRPGVPGLSENITVRSVVGRFLEHSRVFYFENGGDEEIYIGSADWMTRNLKHRIEVIAPVLDPELKHYLKDVVLDAYLRDNVKTRLLLPDGKYGPVPSESFPFNSQTYFIGCDSPQ